MKKDKIKKIDNNAPDNDFQKVADKVSAVTIAGNPVLSVFKLMAG